MVVGAKVSDRALIRLVVTIHTLIENVTPLFVFVASQMIFISGPVVVSPSDKMKFLTIFTSNQNCLNAKWFKIKKGSKKEIDFGSTKYIISNTSDGTKTQTLDVVHAGEEDNAGYQLTINGFRSNMINTFVDGMYSY